MVLKPHPSMQSLASDHQGCGLKQTAQTFFQVK